MYRHCYGGYWAVNGDIKYLETIKCHYGHQNIGTASPMAYIVHYTDIACKITKYYKEVYITKSVTL